MTTIAQLRIAEFESRWPEGAAACVVERCWHDLQQLRAPGYKTLARGLKAWTAQLALQVDDRASFDQELGRCVLARAIETGRSGLASLKVPADVAALSRQSLDRAERELALKPGRYYSPDNDLFAKDLAIAGLRLLPCGAEHVELHSGIPRSTALRSGIVQFFSVGATVTLCGGFNPWMESHWDRRLIPEFTPEGYRTFYLRAARLLQMYSKLKGIIGSSWWLDPALERVSPELEYLSAIQLSHGARRFRLGTAHFATADALRLSRPRQEAHSSGQYQPTVYMIAWDRRSLMRWADAGGPIKGAV